MNAHTGSLNIARALECVSAQRRQKALGYVREEDRRLSLAVYLLLQEALEKEYGITQPQEFGFIPGGKPFLKDYPHIHFNLSHCPGAALCVVADTPVGCDIERVEDTLDMDLCRHCCSRQEMDAILGSGSPALSFYTLWTRKEAFLKYTGDGLTDNLPELLDSPRAASVCLESFVSPDSSLVYSTCRPLPY